jgi:hypothetical protein
MDNTAKGFAQKIISQLEHILRALESGEPRKNNPQPTSDQNQSSEKNNPASRQVALPVDIEPFPALPQRTKGKWYQSPQWWKTMLEIIAIPFAIGYAIVTFFQWRDSHNSFITDERAWIELRLKDEVFKSPEELGTRPLTLEAIDIGKTPAIGLKVLTNGEIIPRDKAPSLTYGDGSTINVTGVVYPNSPEIQINVLSSLFTPLQKSSLLNGNTYFTFWATATWRDIFCKSHWTRFCGSKAFTSGTHNAKSCADYNQTDAE